MDGDGRGRARALHREAGAAQAELVGRSRRQIILVVANHRHLPVDADHRFIRQYLIAVKGLPFAGEHADRTGMARGIDAGVFKRLDRALEKNPMLGIDEFGFARAVTEKLRVEQVESRERRARLDESRELQHRFGNPCLAQFLIRPDCDRLDAVLQIRPELLDILGAWTSKRHSDDRNSRFLAMTSVLAMYRLCSTDPPRVGAQSRYVALHQESLTRFAALRREVEIIASMLPGHIGRQGADRRISEKHHDWYIAVHAFVDHVLYSHKCYGITPNIKKFIVDADLFDRQSFSPYARENSLQLRSGRDVNSLRFPPLLRRRQSRAINFAARR